VGPDASFDAPLTVSSTVSSGCDLIDEIRDLFDELASLSKSLSDWDGVKPSAEQLEARISAAEVRVSSVGWCVDSLGDRAGR
jgi:hypothetical protein